MNVKKLKIAFLIICLSFITYFSLSLSHADYPDNIMQIHYIDVGQGDCILIQVNNTNLLIDSGPLDEADKLFSYLNSLSIDKLDYIIATHPHEDHIGNMSRIIKKYKVGKFYAPKVTSESIAFENMVDSLVNKDEKIYILTSFTNDIDLGKNTELDIFTLNSDIPFENLNLYSPIIKISFGETSFLFTGDAEIENEYAAIDSNFDLSADVLKIGHHGSSTSTHENFYDLVDPSIVVISVGEDNEYDHPSKSTLDLLYKKKDIIYRTDLDGTIHLLTNGSSIYKYPCY